MKDALETKHAKEDGKLSPVKPPSVVGQYHDFSRLYGSGKEKKEKPSSTRNERKDDETKDSSTDTTRQS